MIVELLCTSVASLRLAMVRLARLRIGLPLGLRLALFFPFLVAALATYKYKKSEGTKNTNVKGGCYRETQTR